MRTINLDEILKSYLTLETVRANKPDYTYNMILSATKEACRQTLELAAENAEVFHIGYDDVLNKSYASVDRQSILDTLKQIV